MSLPPHTVMMQTLPISELIRMVAAADSTVRPFQAIHSRLRPERMSASISAKAFSPVRQQAVFSSELTCGQNSPIRAGSTQMSSTLEGIGEIAPRRGGIIRYALD